MSFPELPPRRTLPPDVRERMRRKIFNRRPAVRAPLAAAAGAALLVAGGFLVPLTGSDHVDAVDPPTAIPTSRPFAAPDEVREVETTREDTATCGFDQALFTVRMPGRRLLVAPAERFCELTYTTTSTSTGVTGVTFMDARYAAWRSPTGVVAGRVPPGTALFRAKDNDSGRPQPATLVGNGYFVMLTAADSVTVELSFSDGSPTWSDPVDLRSMPVGAHTEDRFTGDEADASGPEIVLARCLDRALRDSVPHVRDTAQWQLGASVGTDTETGIAVLRGPAGHTAYCVISVFKPTEVNPPMPVGNDDNAFTLSARAVTKTDSVRGIVTRLAGVVREDVVRMDLVDPGGHVRPVEVQRNTFATRVTNLASLEAASLAGVRLRAFDKKGALLYEAPVV
ncbi:hypothetical protein FHS29_005718 [Saccharothrix tamanrassetensis]|uniref:Uncharacterized protein n=1 Tax=Saccharothrix tamanrassetensis TaxID=1051531 RepID=A0A841CSG9_9PSEU|nr:hypothetical protein [Saccharothrix tamanrassetensis]MBB5959098.1 hypothetical protein [Saccharothrix tamanrassetensis]